MKIIVKDNLGKDVTHEREWYINTDGKIFYYTGDIDGPLYVVDNDYTWETVPDNRTGIAIGDGVFIFGKRIPGTEPTEEERMANAKRIADAIKNIKKYEKKV